MANPVIHFRGPRQRCPGAGGDGHVTFYVGADDPAAALEKISQLGGRTVQEPVDVPNGPTIALFADPEGHVVGLVKAM
jgi:hypothetical protein